jgi:hypothetical protein
MSLNRLSQNWGQVQVQPMLGFKKFYNARRVIMGVELMQMLHKGQFRLAEV